MTTLEEIFARSGLTLAHDVEGTDDLKPAPKAVSSSIDTTPWGNYKESDYTPAQWHAACLIHQHDGEPTSKAQCKLPVKTPSGKLNKGGVKAAAAALSGARGGVQASVDDKKKAAGALRGHYKTIGMDPPDSLKHSSVIEHYGVKGMRWGSRKGGGSKKSTSAKTSYQKPAKHLSDVELNRRIKRMELEKKYADLKAPPPHKGKKYAHDILQNSGKTVAGAVVGGVTTFAVQRALKSRFPEKTVEKEAEKTVGKTVEKAL